MRQRYAVILLSLAVIFLRAITCQAFGELTLTFVEDPAAHVRIGIPMEFATEGRPSKWGRSWSSIDGSITVNTLAFSPGRTIDEIYGRLTAIKGRVLTTQLPVSDGAFVLEGRDADNMAFYIAARQDGEVVRGFSIVYTEVFKHKYAEIVKRIAQSFELLTEVGNVAGDQAAGEPSLGPSTAREQCEAETEHLASIARDVVVTITSPRDLTVGGHIAVTWNSRSRFPSKLPVYLIFSVPEEVRIETVRVTGHVDGKTREAESVLKGYFVLPTAAPAPQGIEFGNAGVRVFVPFHQPGSGTNGAFNFLPYRAGLWPINFAVVARTSCGERLLTSANRRTLPVGLGDPKVVIQDPFPLEAPNQVVLSKSGAYLLQIFDNRYRVFEVATGALIVERAGFAPNFSPTSRFLTATFGGANARGYREHDIIDLVTGEVIARTYGLLIGWSKGDAFFFDANQDWGITTTYQALASDSSPTEAQALLIADSPSSCHACTTSEEAILHVDIDNGIIAFFNAAALDGAGNLVCELSGGACRNLESRSELEEAIRKDYLVAPFNWPDLKTSWTKIAYSHIDASNPTSGLKLFRHQQLPASQGRLLPSQPPLRIAKTGDWRSLVRPRSAVPNMIGSNSFFDQLGNFSIMTAEHSDLSSRWPTPEWARAEDAGVERYEEPGKSLYENEFAKFKSALLTDFPEMHALIGSGSDFPYEGKLGSGQKIDLEAHVLGAWSLIRQGKPVWILQIHTVEGSGGFGHGALFVLDGRRKGAERLVGAEKGLVGSIPSGEARQIRLQIQIAEGRYLLYSALINRVIHVYDIEEQRQLSAIQSEHNDLQVGIRATKDKRHVLQINSDGQFLLYEIASAKRILSGWFVDDEMIIYNQEGYFWSSYEGASLVNVKFPGMPGLHSFQQFASKLHNPQIIKDLLSGQGSAPSKPLLTPPPRLAIEFADAEPNKPARVVVMAYSTQDMRSLRLFADGQSFKTIAVQGTSVKKEILLRDVAGARVLTVLAVDKGGLVSQPQSINMANSAQSKATLFGVFVGVNKYTDPGIQQLKQAVNDASNAQAAFKLAAPHSYATFKSNLLVNEQASPSTIKSTIEAIAAEARPEDTFVLFFAGHGVKSGEGKFYLTSTHFRLIDPDGTGISWESLAQALSKVKARVILFIDACHSGSIGAQLATNDGAIADLLQGAARPLLVFAAAKGRQYSYENARVKGGYFTHFLCRILTNDRARYDLNKNQTIEISELYLALKEQVSRKVWEDERGSQTPWLARRDMVGDFGLF